MLSVEEIIIGTHNIGFGSKGLRLPLSEALHHSCSPYSAANLILAKYHMAKGGKIHLRDAFKVSKKKFRHILACSVCGLEVVSIHLVDISNRHLKESKGFMHQGSIDDSLK